MLRDTQGVEGPPLPPAPLSGRCLTSPVCDPSENPTLHIPWRTSQKLSGIDPREPCSPTATASTVVALPTPGGLGERVSPLIPCLSLCQAGNSWPQQRRQRCFGWEPRQPSASLFLTPRRKSGKFPRTSFISELICSHSIFGTGLVCRDFFVVIVSAPPAAKQVVPRGRCRGVY